MALQSRELSAFPEAPASVLCTHIGLLTMPETPASWNLTSSGHHRPLHSRGTLKNSFKRAFN